MSKEYLRRRKEILASWSLEGYDTFSGESYPLDSDPYKPYYPTREAALTDGRKRLAELERSQPSSSSGGQGPGGIQDRVYIISPDGKSERVF